MTEGIDVSGWQDPDDLDCDTARAAGVAFCWVKASQGNTNEAKRASEHVRAFSQAGILVGAYHFAGPGVGQRRDDARLEALHFCGEVDDLAARDLRPVLDYETRWTRDRAVNMAWVLEFVETVENALGVTPMLYSGASLLDNRLDAPALYDRGVRLWVADYRQSALERGAPECDAPWTVWQWTSSERPAWANGGRIDHNWCNDLGAIRWPERDEFFA